MADIELVIKIPEEIYCRIMARKDSAYDILRTIKAVKRGKVLPKGHGRIIAEPTEGDIAKTIGGQNDFAECIREAVKAVFDNAQTIIEADEEVDE